MIVRVSVVLKRTVGDSEWRFDNLSGSHLQWCTFSRKGLPHEDFAVLGQICPEIISSALGIGNKDYWFFLVPLPRYTTCSCLTMKKLSDISELYQGELTVMIFLVIFRDGIRT